MSVAELTSCPPRYATPRSDRPTYGTEVARLARLIGLEPMEHQRRFWDLVLEHEDGRLAYQRAVVTKPRQNGFTTAVLCLMLWRCLKWPGTVVKYAAQSGADARAKLSDDWWPLIESSSLSAVAHYRRQSGHEAIVFEGGSRLALLATGSEKTGHGSSVDLSVLDEAWSYRDARLEQSALPAMATRRNAQMLIVSAAGTEQRSPFLWTNLQAAREAAEAGVTEGLCLLEWSAEDGEDPGDVETWRRAIPALGVLIDEAAVRAAFLGMARRDFQRAFLCQWPPTMGDAIIDGGDWEALAEPGAARPPWTVLALDIAPKGRSAAIVEAGEDGDLLRLALLEHGDGVEWVAPALERIMAERGSPHLLVDERACSALLPQLERITDFKLTTLGTSELTDACSFFLRLAQAKRVRHRGEMELALALDSAATRPLGDSWAWSRRKSGGDISPLIAATIATYFWHGAWGSTEEVPAP